MKRPSPHAAPRSAGPCAAGAGSAAGADRRSAGPAGALRKPSHLPLGAAQWMGHLIARSGLLGVIAAHAEALQASSAVPTPA